MDIKSKQDQEIESLARTLKKNRLAISESEAMRMAEEMLGISKKVAADFADREKKIYGDRKQDKEVELAHRQMEMLADNMAKGQPNVRLDLDDMIDLNKPLKDLVGEDAEPPEHDDDDAVEINQAEPEVSPITDFTQDPEKDETVQEEADEKPASGLTEEPEKIEIEHDVDDSEPEEDKEFEPEAEEHKDEEDGDPDFTVKELSEAPRKSEEERKKEIKEMEESKVDLSDVFGSK